MTPGRHVNGTQISTTNTIDALTAQPPTLNSTTTTITTTTTQPNAHTSPLPSLQPQTQPQTLSFSTIIEHDHSHLSHLANLTTHPQPTHLPHLLNLITHLIRHDISEDLVMRPAFTQHLGAHGTAAADQDRRDHAAIKDKLIRLYERVIGGRIGEDELADEVGAAGKEMAVHMREESGVWVPRFEGAVGREVSLELGERYARTLVLTPEVEVEGGKRRWTGVWEYLRAGVDEFREVLRGLEERAERGVDGGYLGRRVQEELEMIGLGGGGGGVRSREKVRERL